MAVNNLADFDKIAGTTDTYAPTNMALNSGAKVAPKPTGFWGQVGHTLATVPGQAASALVHATIDPFAHLIKNAQNAANAGSNAQSAEDVSKTLDQMSKQAKIDFTAGHITRDQYIAKIHGITQQATSLAQGQHENQVKSIKEMAPDAASAILTAATLGAGGLELGGAKAGAEVVGAKVAGSTGSKLAGKVVQSGADTIGVGRTGNVATQAAKGVVKNAFIQPVAAAPGQITHDIKTGDYTSAAVTAGLLAAPAAAGLIGKGIKAAAPVIRDAAFGKNAILTDAFGVKRVTDYITTHAQNPDKLAELKQMELFTKNQATHNGETQGETFAKHLLSIGVDPKTAPMDEIMAQFQSYAKNVKALEDVKLNPEITPKSVIPEHAVISHDFRQAIPAVVAKLQQIGENPSLSDKVKAVNSALDELGNVNQTVRTRIGSALLELGSGSEMAARLKPIVQKMVLSVPKGTLDKGFIATIGPKARAAMPSLEDAGQAGMVEVGADAKGFLGKAASALEKAGIGLKDYNPAQIGMAEKAFTKSVDDLNIGVDGKSAYDTLTSLAESHKVTDLRHLRVGEIAQNLDISNGEARKVLSSLKNMYSSVPMSVRGAAGKLTDANLKFNPLAAPYARIQGALRYGANPAFRAQQRIEAATLGQVVTGGHSPAGDVATTVKYMREQGFIPGIDKGFAGEALHDIGPGTNISTHLTRSEENSLGRVLTATAAKNGRSVQDELSDEGTRRILRAIVQNPKQGFHSTNFAKALNIAAFPLNYNLKVASLATKALMNQPAAVQFGVIKGIYDFNNFLKTDEGIKWRSDNAAVIGLLNYFTPVNSIQQIYTAIADKNPRSLGLIGGLPFGVISRVLEGQGVIPKSNPPYVDPNTGKLSLDQMPITDKARLQTALKDVIDTMFTFPGRQAGLGSKKDLINTITGNVIKPSTKETTPIDRSSELSQKQLDTMRVLGHKPSGPGSQAPSAVLKAPISTTPVRGSITPIYKSSSTKVPRAKTRAVKPANSRI